MIGIFLRPMYGLLLCFLFVQAAFGKSLIVPSASYPTIQSAVSAALDGDEVVVSPGKYVENIQMIGRDIILRSSAPTNTGVVLSTILDGNTSASVVTFSGTESSSCILSGFTITRGKGNVGGGINGKGTRSTISNNRITTNTASGSQGNGGGVADCDGIFENNLVSANRADNMGGGLYGCDGSIRLGSIRDNRAPLGGGLSQCHASISKVAVETNVSFFGQGGGFYRCKGTFQDNLIIKNNAKYGGGFFGCEGILRNNLIIGNSAAEVGGGISGFIGTIERNTITSNTASFWGGGISDASGSLQNNLIVNNYGGEAGGAIYFTSAIIQNNTIYNNRTNESPDVARGAGGLANCSGEIINNIIWANFSPLACQLSSVSLPSYCCIQDWNGGGTGNFNADPGLTNPSAGNFHLRTDSPCVDAGAKIAAVTEDFEGDSRPFIFASIRRGGGSGFDIGADELVPQITQAQVWTLY